MPTTALLVIDIQRDYFEEGRFPLPGMELATQTAAAAISFFRERQQPVVFIQHIESDTAAPFLVQCTSGIEIHPLVQPLSREPVIQKNYPNSFRETELQSLLAEQGITHIVICGAMSNMCVDATARTAFDLGYECTILHDACAASEIQFTGTTVLAHDVHSAFMGALASAYARVVSLDEFIAAGK